MRKEEQGGVGRGAWGSVEFGEVNHPIKSLQQIVIMRYGDQGRAVLLYVVKNDIQHMFLVIGIEVACGFITKQ